MAQTKAGEALKIERCGPHWMVCLMSPVTKTWIPVGEWRWEEEAQADLNVRATQ
jgi:hypothetical protein